LYWKTKETNDTSTCTAFASELAFPLSNPLLSRKKENTMVVANAPFPANAPHKHAELIKKWADGAKIELFSPSMNAWVPVSNPCWSVAIDYRLKVETKPDIVRNVILSNAPNINSVRMHYTHEIEANARIVFDGESNQLKELTMLTH
tara:strand:- start:52 stop:492 length:441 start_codon:yes stop_codon:yes gene_type:complete